MKLWECRYNLDCKYWMDKSVDYWFSTTKPGIETQQRFWDKIFPGFYTVSDFVATEFHSPDGHVPLAKILVREYKSL